MIDSTALREACIAGQVALLVAVAIALGEMCGCGGAPFEFAAPERESTASTRPDDALADSGEAVEVEASTSDSGLSEETSAPVPEASPTAQTEAAPPACSTPPSGSSCVSGAAPDVFQILYTGGGCNAHDTPPGCRACAEAYACDCILAGDPGVCGGDTPVSCTLTDIVTVTCP